LALTFKKSAGSETNSMMKEAQMKDKTDTKCKIRRTEQKREPVVDDVLGELFQVASSSTLKIDQE
jgi:hypothetical protein